MTTRLSPLVRSRLRFPAHVRGELGRSHCIGSMTFARLSDAGPGDVRVGVGADPGSISLRSRHQNNQTHAGPTRLMPMDDIPSGPVQ